MPITNIDCEILTVEPEKTPVTPAPQIPPAPVPDNVVPMPVENAAPEVLPEPDEPEDPEIATRLSVDQPRYKNRIDATRERVRPRPDDGGNDDLKDLLDQAVSLLESIPALPAMADFSNLKQRLENVEQVLGASGNVR